MWYNFYLEICTPEVDFMRRYIKRAAALLLAAVTALSLAGCGEDERQRKTTASCQRPNGT